jgi:putative FmdB family regulatory protein
MPLYEYRCRNCGECTEVLQHLDEPPMTVCPQCGGVVDKVVSAPALQFKGSGWYVTDYRRGGAADRSKELAAKSDSGSSSKSPESPASTPSEQKKAS